MSSDEGMEALATRLGLEFWQSSDGRSTRMFTRPSGAFNADFDAEGITHVAPQRPMADKARSSSAVHDVDSENQRQPTKNVSEANARGPTTKKATQKRRRQRQARHRQRRNLKH